MTRKEGGAYIFFVTPVCNNRCFMCCAPIKQETITEHPPFDYVKEEIDKLSDMKEIYLTGGEPTTSPYLFRLIDYIKNKEPEAKVNIVTNGRMFFYKNFTRKMINSGVNKIVTEIYGSNSELHDKITRTPGSFEQTIEGIKNLIEFEQYIELRLVVHKMNYKKLPEMALYVSQNLHDVKKVVMFPFNIVSHALKNRDLLQITYKDIIPFLEESIEIFKKRNMNLELYHIPFCVIDKKHWSFLKGITTEDYKISLLKECRKCLKKDECSLPWKSYIKYNGKEEFRAIENE